MKEYIISSVTEFVQHIENLPNPYEFWFRGVSKTSYLPLPKLVWKNIQKHEGNIEHDFLVSYKSYIDNNVLNPWEIYSLMQHHGLPTRLLDWSESALVALFFALTSDPSSNSFRAVWVLNPWELNKITLGSPKVYCPAVIGRDEIDNFGVKTNLNSYLPPNLLPDPNLKLPDKPMAIMATKHLKRVSSQRGCFTVHGNDNNSVDTYLKKDSEFYMIKIDARSINVKNKMLNTLACMGIDEEMIFQDLDSLCNTIKRSIGA